ncbi:MAG: hypothetical protein VX080_09600 [SAR324 cluster bacterium]|nr:hypothetical protein [SAR324 cluster bacterium]
MRYGLSHKNTAPLDLNSNDGEAEKLMRGREVVQDKVHAGTKPKLFWLT